MRTLILKMHMTLDGFVEGPHGEMDWFDAGAGDQWEEEFALLKTVDAILMGRGMYPDYAAYWRRALTKPSSPKSEVTYARLAETIPHVVFSRTLKAAEWGNTQIMSGDLKQIVRTLKRRRGKALLALGGAKFASSLLNLGLVDELQLIVNPALLGGGKSLFRGMKHRQQLKLARTTKFRSGAVLLRYSRA